MSCGVFLGNNDISITTSTLTCDCPQIVGCCSTICVFVSNYLTCLLIVYLMTLFVPEMNIASIFNLISG